MHGHQFALLPHQPAVAPAAEAKPDLAPRVPDSPRRAAGIEFSAVHEPGDACSSLLLLLRAAEELEALEGSGPGSPSRQPPSPVSLPAQVPQCGKLLASEAHLSHAHHHHHHQDAQADDVVRCTPPSEAGGARGRKRVQRKPGDKKHKCSWEGCGMSFPTTSELTCHVRTHTGEKPFKCEFAGCGKAFAQSGGLVRHRRTHTGEKPYECHVCGKCFAESGHLTRHTRTHSGAKPFDCSFQCGRQFATAYHLSRHECTHGEGSLVKPAPQ